MPEQGPDINKVLGKLQARIGNDAVNMAALETALEDERQKNDEAMKLITQLNRRISTLEEQDGSVRETDSVRPAGSAGG